MEKQLKISSTIDELAKVEKIIDDIAEECKLSSQIYGNMIVSCLEAVNNSIKHGNKMDISKPVTINFKYSNKQIVVRIDDCGSGFDYSNIPDPTVPSEVLREGGRGIFIMSKLADKINFYEPGNSIELTFYNS